MDPDPTLERLARARAGDENALSDLLAAHEPRLSHMIELRLDPSLRRRLDPADVVQEALLAATRRFPEWCAQDHYPFHVWLRLLTSQALLEAQRRHLGAGKREAGRDRSIESGRSSVSAAYAAQVLAATSTSPTQAARREETRARVQRALEELEELDREILSLRHFEGLSNADAALELGIQPDAASKRYARALQRLRPALGGLAPDAG